MLAGKSEPKSLSHLLSEEMQLLTKGQVLKIGNPDDAVFSARVQDWDFRKAEAICVLHDEEVHPFQKMRSFLMRGQFEKAATIMDQQSEVDQTPYAQTELLLEKARLAGFKGDWITCFETCLLGIENNPAAVTRLSLHQVRAAAYFELGEYKLALRDIEMTLSLSKLFPFSPCKFYAELYHARILSHRGDSSTGLLELNGLWERKTRSGELNAHILLCLLKAEIDIKRMAGQAVQTLALASYHFAKMTGDSLYRGLALMDLFYSNSRIIPEVFLKELNTFTDEFERIKRIISEVESQGEPRTSASRSIHAHLKSMDLNFAHFEIPVSVCSIVFVEREISVSLDPFVVTPVSMTAQFKLALQSLSRGPLTKEKFFHKVWGTQKYVSHLHDGHIKSLLNRIRAAARISIKNQDGVVSLCQCLVVE